MFSGPFSMSAALQLYRHDWQWRDVATRYQARQMSRKGKRVDGQKLQLAYASPASREMRMMENVFFKDGDSHVWTGSGCGYGLV